MPIVVDVGCLDTEGPVSAAYNRGQMLQMFLAPTDPSLLTTLIGTYAVRVTGPAGSLYTGVLVIVVAVVSLVFHKSVYQTYSRYAPHRDSGFAYVLIYFVAPLVVIAIGGVMVLGVIDGRCILLC